MLYIESGVVPLRKKTKTPRLFSYEEPHFDEFVRFLSPDKPTYLFDSNALKARAKDFLSGFPGDIAYAVKCNPTRRVLQTLSKSGISSFDVASLEEIRQVRKVNPAATLYYMNPVKTPESIRAAYYDYDVRIFVLDHRDELFKIVRETSLAQDLDLYVRVALPKNPSAQTDFSSKFGAEFDQALELLKLARPVSRKLGISFHVGTQSMDPQVYDRAISYVAKMVASAGIEIDALDVGGGFPVAYEGLQPVPLAGYFQVIRESLKKNRFDDLHILCEPGRAMVADSTQLITRVELRRGDLLYINDGVYGGLVEMASWCGLINPYRLVTREGSEPAEPCRSFRLTGPTCDSLDMMAGPFLLPESVAMGDWIVFQRAGAYSQSCRSGFNGFAAADVVPVQVRPPLSRRTE
ncbi:MAG: type III PLP-dependent enzyme [Rhodospirillales bacterium]|nr:type III PLP-dependent enzyme [Rhodospirillales bacterium]MCB9965923.1 type III PLP-dependent enzyme [Rhodospirillales bacterium]